jgi:glucarate dehydratase
MRIKHVRVTPIAFRDPPLLNASGIHEPYALRSIIEVESASGIVGLGESYGDAATLSVLTRVAQELPGLDAYDLNGLRLRIAAAIDRMNAQADTGAELAPGSHPSKRMANAYSAFEVACLDLQARSLGVPLVMLLGGAVRREVPFSAYLFFKYAAHIDTPYPPDTWGEALHEEQIVEQARRMVDTYGFGSIKLKAGVFTPEHETRCIKALRRAFPSHPLRIDPNAGWSIETAVRVADMIGRDIEYYEDPTASLEGMAELRRRTGMALATNMVVTDLDEFRRNVALGAVQIILADHHYWGGLRDTQILARMCATFGLGVSMHSNSHLGISLMAMAHVAAAVPNLSYACDTHYPWQDEEVVVGGKVPIVAGCVRISDSPGLGVDLDRERLRALHEQFLAIDIRSRDDARQMRKYDPSWRALQPRF